MIETVLASKTDRSIYKAFLHLGVFQRFVSSGLKLQFFDSTQTLEWDRFMENWYLQYNISIVEILIQCEK